MHDQRSTPGAIISGFWLGKTLFSPVSGSNGDPVALSFHGSPDFPCAPTAITPGRLAGDETSVEFCSEPTFPAAATMKIPSPMASSTAAVVSDDEAKIEPGSEPKLRDMISASSEIQHHLIA